MPKRSFINRSLLTGIVLGGTAALVVGYGPALAQQAGIKPAVIATVRLSVVMEKLDQRAEASARLATMSQQVRADEAKRKEELQKMQDQLDQMRKDLGDKPAPPEAVSLQETLALNTLRFQAWSRFTLDKVDIENSLTLQDLYRSVKLAAAQMASANGYDLVIVDDSQLEIQTSNDSRTPRTTQVMSQISSRRILHSNPNIDITDELITRMNNAYKAAGAAAAVPPAANGGAGKP